MSLNEVLQQKLQAKQSFRIKGTVVEDTSNPDYLIVDPSPGKGGPIYRVYKEYVKVESAGESSTHKQGYDIEIRNNAQAVRLEVVVLSKSTFGLRKDMNDGGDSDGGDIHPGQGDVPDDPGPEPTHNPDGGPWGP